MECEVKPILLPRWLWDKLVKAQQIIFDVSGALADASILEQRLQLADSLAEAHNLLEDVIWETM